MPDLAKCRCSNFRISTVTVCHYQFLFKPYLHLITKSQSKVLIRIYQNQAQNVTINVALLKMANFFDLHILALAYIMCVHVAHLIQSIRFTLLWHSYVVHFVWKIDYRLWFHVEKRAIAGNHTFLNECQWCDSEQKWANKQEDEYRFYTINLTLIWYTRGWLHSKAFQINRIALAQNALHLQPGLFALECRFSLPC